VNWILDADLRDFFTSLDQGWLMKFLEHRIADERVLRLIGGLKGSAQQLGESTTVS
jgi:retron-type reverse transcriptase